MAVGGLLDAKIDTCGEVVGRIRVDEFAEVFASSI